MPVYLESISKIRDKKLRRDAVMFHFDDIDRNDVLLEGFYTNSPGACIFWVFGGYLIHGIYQDQEQTVK